MVNTLSVQNKNGNIPSNTVVKENLSLLKDSFFVRTNNILKKVCFDEIAWIEAEGNYSIIKTKNRKYIVKISLRKLFDKLPFQRFIQIHKSFIVKLDLVEKINMNTNMLSIGEEKLPLGRVYKRRLLEKIDIL